MCFSFGDGGARSALITPAAMFQAGGRAQQAQGHIPAALAHAPGSPHGQLVSAQPQERLCSCCSPGQGSRAMTLPGQGQEQEPPGLETAVSPALQAPAQTPAPQSSDQLKQVTASLHRDRLRLPAFFKPLHQKPWLHLPLCTGC